MSQLLVLLAVIAILSIVSVLGMAVLMYRFLSKTNKESQDQLASIVTVQTAMAREQREWLEKYASAARTQQTEFLESATASILETVQAISLQSLKTADLMQTRSTAGLEASLRTAQTTIQNQSTLLASKDPIAFSQLSPAPVATTTGSGDYYAAVDEQAEADLRKQMEAHAMQAQIDAAMANLRDRGIPVGEPVVG